MEYLLFIVLMIMPLWYKFSFWLYVIQLKEYRWDRFAEYIKTKQWKNALFNFWFFVEVPILLFSLTLFINPLLEIIMVQTMAYLLICQNIFVLGKIVRRNFIKPKMTLRMLMLSFFIILDFILCTCLILFYKEILIYLFIMLGLLFPYIIILLWNFILSPLTYRKKNSIMAMATEKIKMIYDVIKIWVTWSYWKSSVKEFLSSILEKEWNLLKTPKNINTELWVSQLILDKLDKKYDYFVAEMWAYKIWEIADLWNIVNHKHGFLTAVWSQHLWLFGSMQNIKDAKAEIAEKVLINKGRLYVNWDCKEIREIKFHEKLKLVKYWLKQESADIKSEIIWFENMLTEFKFKYNEKEYIFKTNLVWNHNILNLTWVIGFCIDLWIKQENIKKYLLGMKVPEWTLTVENKSYNDVDITILDDSHNLSEKWLLAGLKTAKLFEWEKILVMDDVLELWSESAFIHFNLWIKIAKKGYIDKLLYVWANHMQDFTKGLAAWGFDRINVISSLSDINKKSIILFEWKRAGKYNVF